MAMAVPVPRFGLDEMRILVVADFYHVLRREQFDAVALRLLDDTVGKFRTCYSLGKTRIVIEALGNTGLPPEATALDDQHVVAIASRVNRRR